MNYVGTFNGSAVVVTEQEKMLLDRYRSGSIFIIDQISPKGRMLEALRLVHDRSLTADGAALLSSLRELDIEPEGTIPLLSSLA